MAPPAGNTMGETDADKSLAAVETAYALVREFYPVTMRTVGLRIYLDWKRMALADLSGRALMALSGSGALFCFAAMGDWWWGLPCLPLSLYGAHYARLWRDLRYGWAMPIVVEDAPIADLLRRENTPA